MANSIPLVSPVPSLYSLETLDQKWRRETYSTYQRLPETESYPYKHEQDFF